VSKELMLSHAFPKATDPMMSGEAFDAFDHPEGSTLVSCTLCFGAVVNMVKHYGKKATGFDGTHCKSMGDAQLLVFEAQDMSNSILPLTVNLCNSECCVNYALCLDAALLCGLDLNVKHSLFTSDRSKAGFKLMRTVAVKARQRCCLEHILRNMNHVNGELTLVVQYAVRDCFKALTRAKLDEAMAKLQSVSAPNYDYLLKIPLREWAGYTYVEEGVKTYGIDDNNTAESEASRMLCGCVCLVCVCLCLSFCLSVPICLCLGLPVPLCVCLGPYMSVCVCLYLVVAICVCLCMSMPLCVCLGPYMSVCVCLCLVVAIFVCLCMSMPVCVCRRLSVSVFVCIYMSVPFCV
jgi:hypothetical protein